MQQGANSYQKDVLGKSAFDYANESGGDAAITQLVAQIPAGSDSVLHHSEGIPETYAEAIHKLDQVGWEQMLFAKGRQRYGRALLIAHMMPETEQDHGCECLEAGGFRTHENNSF
eukprot:751809-Amphidinium_carterae.1